MSDVEKRLEQRGLTLPDTSAPLAAYVPAVAAGGFVYTAGQVPRINGVLVSAGRVGGEVTKEDARSAAQRAALQAISAIRSVVGDLDHILQIVKVTVFVASAPGFTEQSFVADGASELFQTAFGERGKHARSAVGVAELPLGSCVEVEVTAQAGQSR